MKPYLTRRISLFFLCLIVLRIQGQISIDSREQVSNFRNQATFQDKFTTSFTDSSLLQLGTGDLSLGVNPAFDVLYGNDNNQSSIQRIGIGSEVLATYNRWKFKGIFLHNQLRLMEYQKDFVEKQKVIPGMGLARGSDALSSEFVDLAIQYEAKRFFTAELGYGRNFIGDGYRSLLLSDFSQAQPYFKLKTKFWHLEYTNVFSLHQNIWNVESSQALFQQKYTATHFLDWKIAKWISVGLFESIVWAADDGVYHRGFDVSYLNPIIFYRPVEFSVGSSDNAILGSSLKITPSKSQKLYFQVLFDEFLLDELRADVNQWRNPDQNIQSGWWANKYGIQAGWQGLNPFGFKGFSYLFEFNLVRPYTYAHTNPTQAYSHYNMSLAHPLGANFHETIARLNYQKRNYSFLFQYNNSFRGQSPIGTNFGDNLELSNKDRETEYENYIGQGITSRVEIVDIAFSYAIKSSWNATASLGYTWRQERFTNRVDIDNMIYFRLRTNIFNQYFDI